jgi:chromosome segregation ATPase
MALELYDIMKRYNDAKAIEDDMMKDIELQKIQAEFIANNDMLDTQARRISELEEDVNNLRVERERLKDSNAELRLKIGGYVPEEPKPEPEPEPEPVVLRTLSEIATDF